MRIGQDGWLEVQESGLPPVLRFPTVRTSQLDIGAGELPLGIVWHWAGGNGKTEHYAENLAKSIQTYDKTKDRAASWHVLVAKDGRLLQSAPFNVGTWHVGRPGRIGDPSKLFGNINRATIGVELENAGRLEKVGDRYYCWPFWLDPDAAPEVRQPDPKLEIPPERAVVHEGAFFDSFPEAQEHAAARLLQTLVVRFRWRRSVCRYGHFQFDSPRKEDPGPFWMNVVLPRVLDRVFGSS